MENTKKIILSPKQEAVIAGWTTRIRAIIQEKKDNGLIKDFNDLIKKSNLDTLEK